MTKSILYLISSLLKSTSSSTLSIPRSQLFKRLIVLYSFFINKYKALFIKFIFASSLSIVFSLVKGNLVNIKSIPFLTLGTSESLIISQRAFTTVIFRFGNCLSTISFCLFSSSIDLISEYLLTFSNKYLIPLALKCLHLSKSIQYTPKKLRSCLPSSILINVSKLPYINLVVSSLLSSSPGIREESNPGRHNFNSTLFNLVKILFTILSKNFLLFGSVALGKKGKRPYA